MSRIPVKIRNLLQKHGFDGETIMLEEIVPYEDLQGLKSIDRGGNVIISSDFPWNNIPKFHERRLVQQ